MSLQPQQLSEEGGRKVNEIMSRALADILGILAMETGKAPKMAELTLTVPGDEDIRLAPPPALRFGARYERHG